MSAPSRHCTSNGPLRAERHGGAVDMGLEGDAAVVDAPQLGQRHDLIAAAVGEDRLVPMHEAVQAAELGDALRAGPEHQMVGIGEQDVGAGSRHVLGEHGLDRGAGADRHEGWRAHDPARRHDGAGPRAAVARLDREGEGSAMAPHSRCRAEQAGIAIGIEAIALRHGMGIGVLHDVETGKGCDQHEQG